MTAEAIAVVQTLLKGHQSSAGKQAYFHFQPAAGFANPTVYDTTTSEWSITNPDSNGEWVTKMLEWTDVDSLDLTGITSDDLIQYMVDGMTLYGSVLQTITPDLTPFQSNGGKLLLFHGEADTSIPPCELHLLPRISPQDHVLEPQLRGG